MDPLISLQAVDFRYKRPGSIFRAAKYFDVLQSINLEIYAGQSLAIIGRNGAGKSSLLRLISGVLRPSKGQIINRGATVSMLVLNAGFDPNLSGRDNAIFGGMLQGYSRREMVDRLDEIQDYTELGEFFDQPMRIYSTGMRARLGFAISILMRPDVLLIDEVLSVGDIKFKEKATESIRQRIASNQSIVLVSHAPQLVKQLSDSAMVLSQGTLSPPENPNDAIERYQKSLHQEHV